MYSILPPSVANELRHRRPVPAMKHNSVSLLFSGIVGFSQFCAQNSETHSAMKIVQLLNTVYTQFDQLLTPENNPNIYKVSTERAAPFRSRAVFRPGHVSLRWPYLLMRLFILLNRLARTLVQLCSGDWSS